jgi:S-adenosylmethionine:tRNA ribosyltransferase-isomerase
VTKDQLTTKDFDFFLPEELIAQKPIKDREKSRMMILNKKERSITHNFFYNIIDYIEAGDCIVLNDTRVIPARLFGKKKTGAVIELLLLRRISINTWECLVKPGKRAKIGTVIDFGDILKAVVIEDLEDGLKVLEFNYEGLFEAILDELGEMPLPPYIKEKLKDKERYQTVYARQNGSAAAPTAGLHFTPELLQSIQDKGIHIAYLTLHVGLGTFRPVKVDRIDDHIMHSEYYELTKENAELINRVRQNKGRIISVGTTSTRTLESIFKKHSQVIEDSGWTDIFIYPGYEFRVIDGLITNFHLPESTLLMLVSAFSDRNLILDAYREAIENKYRFFSFGDAMYIH